MEKKKAETVDTSIYEVPADQLCVVCDDSDPGFHTTEELAPYIGFIGQERAEAALERTFALRGHGHNAFIIESGGSGRSSSIRSFVEKMAEQYLGGWERSDWCYVYNFENPTSPNAMKFANGKGRDFKEFVEERLLSHLKKEIPLIAALKNISLEHLQALEAMETKLNTERQRLPVEFNKTVENAEMHGFGFSVEFPKSGGVTIWLCRRSSDPQSKPVRVSREEFLALSPEQKEDVDRESARIVNEFRKIDETINDYFWGVQNFQEEIKKMTIRKVFREFTSDARDAYENIAAYFEGLENFLTNHYELFLSQNHNTPSPAPGSEGQQHSDDRFLPLRINVFSNGKVSVPVVVEDNPTFYNLFGKLEREGLTVAPHNVPTHMDLKAGSVHKANGGVLIVSAEDVFMHGSWWGLRRVLLDQEVKIVDLASEWGIPLRGLKPEPIPVKMKVVLIGSTKLYHLISHILGDNFRQLFKIPVYFDYETERTDEKVQQFARLIGSWCGNGKKQGGMLHLDTSAVSAVLRQASRAAGSQKKLSLNMRDLKDLCAEASLVAYEKGASIVSAEHVVQAVRDKIYRVDFYREKIQKLIQDGTLLISIKGSKVGEINGLSVLDLRDFRFGTPCRITAKTFAGRSGVISIDREVKLSGASHDKGVLILSGYLGWKYAQEKPLSLSATLSFEQNYSDIDGDSASVAELYALLSSLSGVPIRQDIAVTGSVNQSGEVQPIGGANEKIEGFFDICSLFGLTGTQGVIIPHQNVQNLMLRQDLIDAVKEGKFHIYAVKTIEEGMEILTGVPMGEKQQDGAYKGTYRISSINWMVESKLEKLARASQQFKNG